MGAAAAIAWVAGDVVTDMVQMHPDLMGPTGQRMALDEGFAIMRSAEAVSSECLASPLNDCHFLAVDWMATDGGVDFAMGHAQDTIDEGEVDFFNLPRSEFG